jgi:hypothetical protein
VPDHLQAVPGQLQAVPDHLQAVPDHLQVSSPELPKWFDIFVNCNWVDTQWQ